MIEVKDCSGVMYFDEAFVPRMLNLPADIYTEWQIVPQENNIEKTFKIA
jgi:hypothetical protein